DRLARQPLCPEDLPRRLSWSSFLQPLHPVLSRYGGLDKARFDCTDKTGVRGPSHAFNCLRISLFVICPRLFQILGGRRGGHSFEVFGLPLLLVILRLPHSSSVIQG